MRNLVMVLLLPLLAGCVAYPIIWPYSAERSVAVSGALLDERTQTPVSGADVFFTADAKLRSKSDKDGRFGIGATRYRYWVKWATVGGESEQWNRPLDPQLMITHTNWATQQIHSDQTNQIILLKQLAEPSAVRPWMTFDGNGVILEDGGAVRYLAPNRIGDYRGLERGAIFLGFSTNNQHRAAFIPNGTLNVISVNFAQRVFDAQLTVYRGPHKPVLRPLAQTSGFRWGFWPKYEPTNLISIEDTFYVYRLEFIR